MKIDRVCKVTTPECIERETIQHYRDLSQLGRLDHLLQIIDDWASESERRLKRTYGLIQPHRAEFMVIGNISLDIYNAVKAASLNATESSYINRDVLE